ncbi:MAG TPA: DUF2007 domain-containing protein [Bryobacteraceae bacterium]|nr:DUF2007 domain-containing protein [Bryobacteraceae bacterium]
MSNDNWVIIRVEDTDPSEVCEQLAAAGIEAELVVAVPAAQADAAQQVLEVSEEEPDPSPALDLETIAVFQGADAEMQANAVQGLLEQSGISVVVEGAYGLPSLPFEIKVAGTLAAQARAILAKAEAEGPAAADAEATAG